MRSVVIRCGLGCGLVALLSACPKTTQLEPGGMSGAAGVGATGGSAGMAGASGSSGSGAISGTGGGSGSSGSGGAGGSGGINPLVCGQVYQRPVDVLFVVDNSGSMREEQAALRVQFPRLISTLTSGVRADGTQFVPVSDLHLGVVSTDMGLPGVPGRASLGCGDESRLFGDDGVLRNAPNPGGAPGVACGQNYPSFLAFVRGTDVGQNEAAAAQLASDFGCIASLGTSGCGFEMQLESGLRALWPSDNRLLNGQMGSFADNRPFLDGTASGKGAPTGPNTGFLRNDPSAPSLLAIVLVTDEEDCSSHSTEHFIPEQFLPDGHPLKSVGLNLRCHHESVLAGGEDLRDSGQAGLYSVSRYAQGFKALRPNNEQLVVFAAIVGVPVDLVAAVNNVDFSNDNARNSFYSRILADTRMQERIDGGVPTNPNLSPSCLRPVVDPATGQPALDSQGNPVNQRAFPPRRIVKVAREIGENALVQSICQDDFTPAVDGLIERIGNVIRGECPLE